MIEDKELRDLFKVESEEHLQKLSDGLLRLEKDPSEGATLEEVFREAHSLKGAARMVGVSGVETIAHSIEDIFGKAKKGETVLSSEVIDRLCKGLDSIRKLVNEAATGEAHEISIPEAVAQISAGAACSEAVAGSQLFPGGGGKKEVSGFRIETVRVDTKTLDMLMTQAGELTVTKTHIARRLSEIEEIEEIAEFGARNAELVARIRVLRAQIGEDSARLDFITDKLGDGIRNIRLLPLSTIFNLYPRMVRDMAREKSREVELVIEGGETIADKRIIEEMKDPLMHMIRNSIDHGIEYPDDREKAGKPRVGTIRLKAHQALSKIIIEVSDDGTGLDVEAIKRVAVRRDIIAKGEADSMTRAQAESLIFTSGFSTSSFVSEVSGRGVGLDVVRANVDRLKGSVSVGSSPGAGSIFRVQLPVTLATMRVLIASSDGISYAMPVEYVETARSVSTGDIFNIMGHGTITFDGEAVSVATLAELLEIHHPRSPSLMKKGKALPCIILSTKEGRLGVLVDVIFDEQEVVLKPHSSLLRHVRNVSGATVLATGEVCTVLNPDEMIRAIRRREAPAVLEKPVEKEGKKTVLLAEDSITTRTQEKRILEGAGYEVVTAVDGLDAWIKLNARPFDAVVSDVMMPNMDGLALTSKIRQDRRFKELPVVLVTTLASDDDKKRGLEAGANAYVAKLTFDQKLLIEVLGRLV